MRGTTLNSLIQMLRRELKIAESPALGANTREAHAHALRSAQDRLYSGYDWPFKKCRRDLVLSAGQRYYAPPADLNLEDIRKVSLMYGGQWAELDRGISNYDYNQTNSDAGERLDPALRWEIQNDPDGGDMIEFWPIPASATTARFEGTKKLSPLIADDDRADLDDNLIVLTAAEDYAKDLNKAQAKTAKHYLSLRRNLSNGATFISGGGYDPRANAREPARIVITPARTGG